MSDQVGAFGGSEAGDSPWGGALDAQFYGGKVKCAPITPGTFTLTNGSGTVTDDGEGGLAGDGVGTIDYRTGAFEVTMVPGNPGASITAGYLPAEGGCSDLGCGACKTHRFRLLITPGTIKGQDQLTITEAYTRLVKKIAGITPIHCVWEPIVVSGGFEVQYTEHYDIDAADVHPDDNDGLHVEFSE